MGRSDRSVERAVVDATAARAEAASSLGSLTPQLVATCRSMARRFDGGAVLRPMGRGLSAIDAAHVAVEFVHPVITGKRSLPARILDPADVRFVREGSIVLGLHLGDGPVDLPVTRAADAGATTILLGRAGTDPTTADHDLMVDASDPLIARELQVTLYHLLWELVHEQLDATPRGGDEAPEDLGSLYPFLYSGDADAAGTDDHLVRATEPKLVEVCQLREQVLQDHPSQLGRAAAAIRRCREAGGTVWTFGNGGSSTDAQALAYLLSSIDAGGEAVDAQALTDDSATITALSNDVSFDVVFARTLRSLARPGDVAVGLSTSGGSVNVLRGLEAAHELGLETIGLAGYDGGDMADLDSLDVLFVVRSSSVHRIQEAQTTLLHVLVELSRH